jgi:hypothetical protein
MVGPVVGPVQTASRTQIQPRPQLGVLRPKLRQLPGLHTSQRDEFVARKLVQLGHPRTSPEPGYTANHPTGHGASTPEHHITDLNVYLPLSLAGVPREGRAMTRGGVVVTVGGDGAAVERRLVGGRLACPGCSVAEDEFERGFFDAPVPAQTQPHPGIPQMGGTVAPQRLNGIKCMKPPTQTRGDLQCGP